MQVKVDAPRCRRPQTADTWPASSSALNGAGTPSDVRSKTKRIAQGLAIARRVPRARGEAPGVTRVPWGCARTDLAAVEVQTSAMSKLCVRTPLRMYRSAPSSGSTRETSRQRASSGPERDPRKARPPGTARRSHVELRSRHRRRFLLERVGPNYHAVQGGPPAAQKLAVASASDVLLSASEPCALAESARNSSGYEGYRLRK
jgi:hypothetical protein